MQNLKEKAGLYFEKNALKYKEDYYLRSKIHPKWIRHQRILQLVKEFIPKRDSLILDVGCGPGFLACDLAKQGYQGFGIDISDSMINLSKDNLKDKGWNFSVRDVEQTRFEENKFDCIIASGVIEYMNEDLKMLQELQRILKPGGYLIINVTNIFGYSTSLNSLTNLVKRIPFIMGLLSIIRKQSLKSEHGADNLGFSPRKHFVSNFKKSLNVSGFRIRKNISHHFSILPAPFSTLTESIFGNIDAKLDFLGNTPLKIFSSSNLICAEKVERD
jgi:ubiquinone/menaquinone biosynthesis C-methylase UbiE